MKSTKHKNLIPTLHLLFSFIFASCIIILLSSCDALLIMSYSVKNRSKKEIMVFVPNFPVDGIYGHFKERKDTFITLLPNQEIIVGLNTNIDFPWATKNIYRSQPGICGIKVMKSELIERIGCTKKEWKYRKGVSTLKIK